MSSHAPQGRSTDRPRNYLGLAGTAHDGAIALVDARGDVVFAEATERWLQHKRAWGVHPDDRLRIRHVVEQYCDPDAELVLAKAGSEAGAAFVEREAALAQDLARGARERATAARMPRIAQAAAVQHAQLMSYQHLLEVAALGQRGVGLNSRFELGDRVTATRHYEHHLCHAAFAAYTSPFERAACAVIDGFGEGSSLKFFTLRGGRLEEVVGPGCGPLAATASLGLFYADICRLCGFDAWKGEEWKVMGLAAYGRCRDDLLNELRRCLRVRGLALAQSAETLAAWSRLEDFARRRGEPPEAAADLACSGQTVFEELLGALLESLHAATSDTNLVLSGGCALNSSYNGKIVGGTPFTALHVPSAPADDGNAVGAALLAFHEDHPGQARRPARPSPFTGSSIARDTLRRAAASGAFAAVETLPAEPLAERIALALQRGLLVAVVNGRAEFGPRALGNRSILADPRCASVKDRINSAVKFRESYRPFAPAILEQRTADFFVDAQESPYMERTLRFRADVAARVPAVVHADGTGRLQTIRQDWSPLLHAVVTAFERRTSVPMVVNTSFNVMGKPIVHSVEDALAVFATSRLDMLAIEDHLFTKPAASHSAR